MPTPGAPKVPAAKTTPPKSPEDKQKTKAPPPKKHKSRWVLFLFFMLLLAVAASYWKPLAKLTSSMFNKPPGVTASAAPVNPAAMNSIPTPQASAVEVKPAPAVSAAATQAAPATAPAGGKTSTPVSEAVEIAKSYAAMSPSKAAAVLQTQTPEEIVYAMAEMSSIERAHIWSKMDPGTVADVAYRLKRHSEWTGEEIKSLQQKVYAIKQQELLKTPSKNVALTYAQMPPAAAAKLIDQMLQSDRTHTLSVVGSMENAARTQILTVMIDDPALMDSAISITQSLQK